MTPPFGWALSPAGVGSIKGGQAAQARTGRRPRQGPASPPRPKESDLSHHRMRLPHAKITILALCGLAAAAGVAAAASPAVTGTSRAPSRPTASTRAPAPGWPTPPTTRTTAPPPPAAPRPGASDAPSAWTAPPRPRSSRTRPPSAPPGRDARGLGSPGPRRRLARHRGEGGRRPCGLRASARPADGPRPSSTPAPPRTSPAPALAAEARPLDPPDRDLRRPHGAPARGRRRGRAHPRHRQAPHGPRAAADRRRRHGRQPLPGPHRRGPGLR